MPRIVLSLIVLIALLAAACGGGSNDADTATDLPGTGTIATATATVPGESSVPEVKPTEAPTPQPSEITVANEPFSVETPDGVILHGHLYSPDGPKRRALVIVAPVEQSVWAESTQAFTSEGIAVFTFDPRSFGETGGSANQGALAADVRLITRFVMSREYPLVYVFAAGEEAGAAAAEVANNLPNLTGVATYGFSGDAGASHLSLAPEASWSGEAVLDEPEAREAILGFVSGN
jgi:hypothetical protein